MNKIFPLLVLGSSPAFAVNLTPFIEASLGGAGAWAKSEVGNDLGLSSKNKRLTGSFHGGLHGGGDVYITSPSSHLAFTLGAGIGGMLATKRSATQTRSGSSGGGGVPFEGDAGSITARINYTSPFVRVEFLDFGTQDTGDKFPKTPDIFLDIGNPSAPQNMDFSCSQYSTTSGRVDTNTYMLNGVSATIDGRIEKPDGITRLGINAPGTFGNLLATPIPLPADSSNDTTMTVNLPADADLSGGGGGGSSGGSLKFHSKGYWDVSARLGMKWHRLHLIAKLGYAHHGLKAYSLSSSGSWAGLKTRGVPCLLTGLGATFDLTPSWAVGATAQVHLGKFKVKGYSSGTPFTLKQRFRAVEGLMTLTYKIGPSRF